MNRIDTLKEKLRAARSELKIRQRQFQAACRCLDRVLKNIDNLEKKLATTNLA
jgi:hypothetical protein